MKEIDKIIAENINKFIKENIETEYLDKRYGIPLKKYFKMTDKEQNIEWFYRYGYYVNDWLERNDLASYGVSDEDIQAIAECEYGDETCEILQKYPKAFADCANFIKTQALNYENPPTFHVMDYTTDIYNQWLIHFSDNAMEISNNGFEYATDDIDSLGYSGAGRTSNKESEGYNFAYVADYCPNDGNKYGSDAVMFRASGIQATHFGDEEEQVMFWNKDAKDIVLIRNGRDSYYQNSRGDYVGDWFIESTITGDIIYDSDNLHDVIAWVQKNFAQYHRHLVDPKESKMRRKQMQNSNHTFYYKNKG